MQTLLRCKAVLLGTCLAALLAARPAVSDCPGTTTCTISRGCPAGTIVVNAGKSIQSAINSAPDGAKICVRPGTYGKVNFNGKRILLVSSGGPAVTILDGGGNCHVVTFNHNEGAGSAIVGFTIQNGKALDGGGIYVKNASPTIRNCIVQGNQATGFGYPRGGGLWVGGASSRPVVTCTQFLSNRADYGGGGLASVDSGDAYLRTNHFEGNTASYGGAIAVHHNGRLDVATTSFSGNQAGDGGAVHVGTIYGAVLVRRCWFRNNQAGTYGGAIWVPAGLAQIANCTFDGNRAPVGSGVAAYVGGMANIAGSIFVNQSGSAALLDADGPSSNTVLVNHYNAFFGNAGGDFSGTVDDQGLLFADPGLGGSCCPTAGAAIDAGIPDYLFNDANGTTNDMGACGGPAL